MYRQLEPFLGPPGQAVELGCGVGHGVLWLLEKGWSVLANDADPEALEIVCQRAGNPPGLRCETAPMESIDLGQPNLIVAGFSLFFLDPPTFEEFFPRMLQSLAPGGLFCGQLLGLNDEWKDRGYVLHDAARVDRDLSGLEILLREEVERDGETAMGTPKHWHVFHLIARRPV
ncbi:MAG TPA: class I SAM-dependent methyltransferase [Fimbriimonadaceae bacterium]|nr:class I SAM-dependent methyltransferase [Fimbriimonadaceae bacterium]HRJ33151.1 class I SAM-dependent methyltransferase [Fimbriimonadaceae bacterium]